MTIVLKFGGSSVANISRIRRVAKIIIEKYIQKNEQIVVVVSAMAGMTDQFNNYLEEIGATHTSEDDLVLSAGESITTALLAISLKNMGYITQSFLGWQLPIITNSTPRNAKILNVSVGNLHRCFDQNTIPIVAGFQGITEFSRITTLGRGGSDTTAVALAAALNAERCDIYTDVDGVYTADPRIVPSAKKLEKLSYEEMFELSLAGAKILQARSVELAMKYHVLIHVCSSFVENKGTLITHKEKIMENLSITGIAHQQNIVKFDVSGEDPLQIFAALLNFNIPLDFVSQNTLKCQEKIIFLVESSNAEQIEGYCKDLKDKKIISHLEIDYNIAKISVIGVGIGCQNKAILTALQTCQAQKIPILSLILTPLHLSLIITKTHIDIAVLALHSAFELSPQ